MRYIACLFLILALPASGIVLTVNTSDHLQVPVQFVNVIGTPDGYQTNGAYIAGNGPLLRGTTDTNGSVSFTNVIPNGFTISIATPFKPTSFHISITNGTPTNASLNAKDLITVGTNSGFNAAYPMALSDSFYVRTNHSGVVTLTNVANAFTGAFTGNGAGLTNIAGAITLSKAVFVDPNGNNGTGTHGRPDKPFLTLTAAKNAAISGDTIFVNPGTYTDNNLLKNGVNWHFYAGVLVTYTQLNEIDSARGIFDDRDTGAVTCIISGQGNFRYDCGNGLNNPNILGFFVTTNASSDIRFSANDVSFGTSTGNNTESCFYVINCAYVTINIVRMLDIYPLSTSVSIGVNWIYGEMYFTCEYISPFGNWGIWANEVMAGSGFTPAITQPLIANATNNMWVKVNFSEAGCYMSEVSVNMRTWWDVGQIVIPLTSNIAQAFEVDGKGKHYARIMKVQGRPCLGMSTATNPDDLQVWFECQKMSSTGVWMSLLKGTLTATVGQFEDLGITIDGIHVDAATGNFRIRGQRLKMATGSTGKPVNFVTAGSKLLIEGMTIDATLSTQPPVTTAAAGLTLKDCALVAAAGVDSIKSTAAQNVAIYGTVMANKPKNANITIQAGSLVIDSNVQ